MLYRLSQSTMGDLQKQGQIVCCIGLTNLVHQRAQRPRYWHLKGLLRPEAVAKS